MTGRIMASSAMPALALVLALATFWAAPTLAAPVAGPPSAGNSNVCVIGAGPSGVVTAFRLQNKGYDVTLLDKNDYVGGRTYTYSYRDRPVEMGAILLTYSYKTTLALAREFNCSTFEWHTNTALFDSVTGLQEPLPNPSQATLGMRLEDPEFRVAFAKWLSIVARYTDLMYGPGMIGDYPELQVPTIQWLAVNNLTVLAPFFTASGTNYGYGTLDQVPAQSHVKEFGWGISFTAMNGAPRLRMNETMQVLMERIAATLPDVRLGASISSLTRAPGQSLLTYSTPDAPDEDKTLACGRVVIAFPQLLSSLGFVDLDEGEAALFAKVQSSDYWTSAIDLSPYIAGMGTENSGYDIVHRMFKDGQPSVLPDGDGEVLVFAKMEPSGASGVYTFYSFSRTPTTEDVVREKLLSFLPKVLNGQEVDSAAVLTVRHWPDYFPHVNGTSLAGGFYSSLEDLQGYRGTYYTGALLGFDTVEASAQAAEDLVNRFF